MMNTSNIIKQSMQGGMLLLATLFCTTSMAATTLLADCTTTPAALHTAIATANANSTTSNLYTINISGTCYANAAGGTGTFTILAPMILQQYGASTALPAVLDGSAQNTLAATRVVNVSTSAGGTEFDNLTIQNGNVSGLSGAGILNAAIGAGLTINNSTIQLNTVGPGGGEGGGISNSGVIALNDSIVQSNSVAGGLGSGNGAGLFSTPSPVPSTSVSGCYFFDNHAAAFGGAIYIGAGAANVNNSTFYANMANTGSAIYIANSTLTTAISQSTVASNSSTAGSGVALSVLTSTDITNSIVGNNTNAANSSADILHGNLVNVRQGLVPIATPLNNGGPTLTMVPLTGTNTAINGVLAANCHDFGMVDQRGAPRAGVGKTNCDIGAYETGDAQISLLPPLNTNNTLDFVSTGSPVLKDPQVQNTGNSDLTVTQATVSGSKFSFSTAPSTPITMKAQDIQDFPLVYTPTANTVTSDLGTLNIINNTPNSPVTVNLTGEASGFTPPITTQTIVNLLNADLLNHQLFGEGPNSKSALNRYKAFTNMIMSAGDDINKGDIAGACTQLKDAAAKVDVPQNTGKNFFVGGVDPDITTLYTDITTLMSSLHCT